MCAGSMCSCHALQLYAVVPGTFTGWEPWTEHACLEALGFFGGVAD